MPRRPIAPPGRIPHHSRSPATLITLALLLLATPPLPASVLWPAPDFIIKDHTGSHLTALRWQYVTRAQVLGDFPFVDVDFREDSQALFMEQGDWTKSIVTGTSVAATATRAHVPGVGQNITIDAFADLGGRASVEKLGGHTLARLANGQASSDAWVSVEFQDVIQITAAGHLGITWKTDGTANEIRHPILTSLWASSGAIAEAFIWPFGPVPQTGQSFPFEWLGRDTFSPGQELPTGIRPAGRLFNKPPGTRWWVWGRLTIQSRAEGLSSQADLLPLIPPNTLGSTAQFSNSAQLFIDPDPATPDAAFTSNSGYSYATPIPEPSDFAIFAAATAALTIAGRPRRNAAHGPPPPASPHKAA